MSSSNHSDYQQLPCISLDVAKAGEMSRAAKSLGLDRKTLQQSPDARDRRIAVIALGGVGEDKAREALIAMLRSSSIEERESAVSALGHIKGHRTLGEIAQTGKKRANPTAD